MSKIKLDAKQQKQIIQDLKSREVSEEMLHKVAGGIKLDPGFVTTTALGEEGNPPNPIDFI